MERGANIDAKDRVRSRTVLYFTTSMNGTSLTFRCHYMKDSWTPLHAAASKGHDKVVGVLLESGANFNYKNTVM